MWDHVMFAFRWYIHDIFDIIDTMFWSFAFLITWHGWCILPTLIMLINIKFNLWIIIWNEFELHQLIQTNSLPMPKYFKCEYPLRTVAQYQGVIKVEN